MLRRQIAHLPQRKTHPLFLDFFSQKMYKTHLLMLYSILVIMQSTHHYNLVLYIRLCFVYRLEHLQQKEPYELWALYRLDECFENYVYALFSFHKEAALSFGVNAIEMRGDLKGTKAKCVQCNTIVWSMGWVNTELHYRPTHPCINYASTLAQKSHTYCSIIVCRRSAQQTWNKTFACFPHG